LLDYGRGRRLERFGAYVLDRPDPHAQGLSAQKPPEWRRQAHAVFHEGRGQQGEWEVMAPMQAPWQVAVPLPQGPLQLELTRTQFKHVGLFPEQRPNWQFLQQELAKHEAPRLLNLFAYTGGASLAAASAGAAVVHVESLRQLLDWAHRNAQLNGLGGIRWLREDALKYLRRAMRRGERYNALVMDPPAFGHGPKGQRWQLKRHLPELLQHAGALLPPETGTLVLNTYAPELGLARIDQMLAAALPTPLYRRLGYYQLQLQPEGNAPPLSTGWLIRTAPAGRN
jgi:23S rRNA (cytosine1962-C5)-methyltransferase